MEVHHRRIARRGWLREQEPSPYVIGSLKNALPVSVTTLQKHKTRVGELASYFHGVLTGYGPFQDIDIVKLLRACKKFTIDMKRVGQNQSAKDLESNIKKAEDLYRAAPINCRDSMSQLLSYEKTLGIHKPHAVLKDPSGAMGLLWIRRNLSFQYEMYKQILDNEVEPQEAAKIAYKTELEPVHGWALQRLYSFAFKSMIPDDSHSMFARIGGFPEDSFSYEDEEATKSDMRELLNTWRPLISHWKQVFQELDLEDTRRS